MYVNFRKKVSILERKCGYKSTGIFSVPFDIKDFQICLMHIQLAALCLFATGMAVVAGDFNSCLLQPCRQYLGVYYLTITISPSLNLSEVATFHLDGSFDTIDSLADGNLYSSSPPFGAYSNLKGVWNCNSRNTITMNVIEFNYPTSTIPRYVSTAVYNLTFVGNDQVIGTVAYKDYTLASTQNPDQSKWIQFAGPFQYTVTGYKLFMRCDI